MRNRRNKRNFDKSLLNYLNIISKLLLILITLALLLFVYSAIKVKKSTLISKDSDYINNSISENNITNVSDSSVTSSNDNTLINPIEENVQDLNIKKNTTINVALTGDIICGNSIFKDAYSSNSNTYDFSYLFDNIKFNIQTADIAIGSLETNFSSSRNYTGDSKTNSPENLAYTLKRVGFDVLSTANNHCLDNGYSGLENTLNVLDKADLSHTGTFTSAEAKNTILIKNVKGIKIAFLSFSYGTNGISIPNDKSYCVNIINENQIKTQLALAKTEQPDIICVCMHWGTRYQTKPITEQEKWSNLLFQNGADIIIGNHSHVLQPMEQKEITLPDGTTKQCFIAYSLGNFIADQTQNNTKSSAIINLKITKDYNNNKLTFDSINYTPIYIYKDTSKNTQKFSILNLKNTISNYDTGNNTTFGAKNYSLFKTELQNIQKILGD